MRSPEYTKALAAFHAAIEDFGAADAAWSVELSRTFGSRAGDARYTPEGRGEPGSALADAYEARTAALKAFEVATDRYETAKRKHSSN